MMAYIVIFDRKAYQISSKLFADINAYIDDRYVEEHRDSYAERISRLHSLAAEESCPIPAAPMVTKAASLDDALKQIDESFSEMLLRKIDECGMTDAECYKKANIARKQDLPCRTPANLTSSWSILSSEETTMYLRSMRRCLHSTKA